MNLIKNEALNVFYTSQGAIRILDFKHINLLLIPLKNSNYKSVHCSTTEAASFKLLKEETLFGLNVSKLDV